MHVLKYNQTKKNALNSVYKYKTQEHIIPF